MSARSPFADNASKSSRRADKSKKSVIGRGPKREAQELSRSSGRRRAAEDKEEEGQRGTTERRRKRKRKRKQGERVDEDGKERGEAGGRRNREGGGRSHGAVVETKVEVDDHDQSAWRERIVHPIILYLNNFAHSIDIIYIFLYKNCFIPEPN